MVNRKLKSKIVEQFGTQADFAVSIEEDESLVSRIIRGRRHLDSDSQKAWARLLNCDVAEIFHGSDQDL
jgi:hypothetical protein